MLPSSLCSAPVVCGSALSDLSKSPLLHILQLVSPLEPKRGRMVREGWKHIIKSIYTIWICISLWALEEMLQRFLLGSFSWFNQVPLLQTLEAILEDAALWLQRHDITHSWGREETSPDKSVQDKCHSAPTQCPIPTQIRQPHSHHKG